jgi:hypothetical protein
MAGDGGEPGPGARTLRKRRSSVLQNMTNLPGPEPIGAICSTFMQNAPDMRAGRRFGAKNTPRRGRAEVTER